MCTTSSGSDLPTSEYSMAPPSLSHLPSSYLFRPFSLDNFYDYEKHFTVMNYQKGVDLKQVGHMTSSDCHMTLMYLSSQ